MPASEDSRRPFRVVGHPDARRESAAKLEMIATEEPMAEPAAEQPAETTENRDDVRCGSGQSRVDARRKARSGVTSVVSW